jgi:hypothetical protein
MERKEAFEHSELDDRERRECERGLAVVDIHSGT